MRKVPKLRFKEFSDEWEEKKLGDICNIKTGKKDTKDKIENGIYPFFVRSQTVEKINSYSYDGEAILTAGDGVGVGKVFHYINGKFDFHQRVYKLSDFKESYCRFIFEIFRKNFKKEVTKYNAKTSVDSVRLEMISEMKITLPILEEQEKIADFLSNIDKKISLTEEKLELFREYKKGIMQKIFSQELRFKDNNGNDYPEWEEKKLVEISELTSSKRIFLNEYVDKGIPFYRGKEITELKKGKKVTDILYISNKKYNEILEKYDVPKQNEILITAVGTLGNVYLISNNEKFYFKDGNLIWLKNIKSLPKFLTYSLENNYKKILDTAIGSTQKALTIVNLQKLQLIIPVSLEEQQKISDFLSSIDSKIESIEKELEGLKEFKKGLLQQMFV